MDLRFDMDKLPETDLERIKEVIGAAAGDYTEDIGAFPRAGLEAFAQAAAEVIRTA